MIYQLPDCGPKGMARLDLCYLGIFAPGPFCSSTLYVEMVLQGVHHILGVYGNQGAVSHKILF